MSVKIQGTFELTADASGPVVEEFRRFLTKIAQYHQNSSCLPFIGICNVEVASEYSYDFSVNRMDWKNQ